MRTIARMWTVAEWRRRWASLVFLTAFFAIASGVILAVAAGANRTSTAYDRLVERTARYQASIEDDRDEDESSLADIAAMPQVRNADRIGLFFTILPAFDGLQTLLVAPQTGIAFRDIDRPLVVEGRMPAPDDAAEVMANEEFVKETGLGLGDEVELVTLSPEQLFKMFEEGDPGGPPSGPVISARIVGVGRLPVSIDRPDGQLVGSQAFFEEYVDDAGNINSILRLTLKGGDAAIDEFDAALEDIPSFSRDSLFVEYGPEDADRVEDGTRLQATGLYVFVVIASLAAMVALGQALARQIELSRGDAITLVGLGVGGWRRAAIVAMPFVPVVVGGAVLGVLGAFLTSGLFPTGLAGLAEPDPGMRFDPRVLLPGFAIAVLLGSGGVVALSSRAMRRREVSPSPSRLSMFASKAGLHPAAATGVRFALEPGRGERRLPVRTTIAGAAASVAVLAGAVVFSQSLDHMLASPELYGWSWDATVTIGSLEATTEAAEALSDEDDVLAVAVAADSELEIAGEDVETQTIRQVKGVIEPVVLEGHPPHSLDEIALGPAFLELIDASVGDEVVVQTDEGDTSLEIVGSVLFPGGEDNQGLGAWVMPELLERVGASAGGGHDLHIDVAPGADVEALLERFDEASDMFVVEQPTTVKNIARTRAVPGQIAAFVAFLGLAAVVHALLTAARRRRHDIAVLRALGLRRGDGAVIIGWHAGVLGVLSVAIGVPLGATLGRLIWMQFATGAHLVAQPSLRAPALAAVIALPVVATLAAATLPAVATRRFELAKVLRSE